MARVSSKITKTNSIFGLVDVYLAEAQEGTVTIPALVSSDSAAEWVTFETNYGTSGSLIKALNDAWDNGGGGVGGWDGKYTVEVITDATYDIADDAFNTAFLFINPTPGGNVDVTLPAASVIGEGAVIDVAAIGIFTGETDDGMFVLLPDGSDTIMWPGGDSSAANLGTSQSFSKVRLMSNGVDGWGVFDAMGHWGEATQDESLVWTFVSSYRFNGNIPGGVEDNAVSIDAFGNIKDSGVAIGDIGGGGSPTTSIKTGNYPVVEGDANNTVFIMNSGTAYTFTLESAPATNRYFTFVNKGAGACTVYGNSKLIGADANVILGTYEAITIVYDGTIWLVL